MKKILIITIMILLIVLTWITITNGISLGSFEVLGYEGLKNSSQELNSKFEEANKLTTITFNEKMNALQSAAKELQVAKRDYEDKVQFSSPEEIKKATQNEEYEQEFLWTKIGGYATKEGVTLKLEITTSSSGSSNTKDLKFTIAGTYVGITAFIYDLEDDSKLGFKIENFAMQPGGEAAAGQNTNLQATFTVKDIGIKIDASALSNGQNSNSSNSSNKPNTNTNANENTKTTNTIGNTINTIDTTNTMSEDKEKR